LNEIARNADMPKNKPAIGPMVTQPIERPAISPTQVRPRLPHVGVNKTLLPKQKPTIAEAVGPLRRKLRGVNRCENSGKL